MAYTCTLCSLDIKVGDPILADDKMNLSHESCVRRVAEAEKANVVRVVGPIVKLTSPPEVDQAVKVMYHEPCLLPSASKVCTECQKPAISMCPCGALVHHDFGYNGLNCSGRHEAKCAYAAASRELPKKSNEEKAKKDLFVEIFKGRNGKHQKSTKRSRR